MIQLKDDKEKSLWRDSAVASLQAIEEVETDQPKKAALFASIVADNIVSAYRKRCEGDE